MCVWWTRSHTAETVGSMGVGRRGDLVGREARARRVGGGMVVLLLAQFLAGIVVNLYTTIPKSHPGSKPTNYFAGSSRSIGWAISDGGAWLAVHVILGVLLILCGA